MSKHTATPWSIDPITSADVRGPDKLDIAVALCKQMKGGFDIKEGTVGPESREAAKANAAYIVKCVNAHADLVAALEKLVEFHAETIKEVGGCDHSVGICCCADIRAVDAGRAALSKAAL